MLFVLSTPRSWLTGSWPDWVRELAPPLRTLLPLPPQLPPLAPALPPPPWLLSSPTRALEAELAKGARCDLLLAREWPLLPASLNLHSTHTHTPGGFGEGSACTVH
eukprot:1159467-Pelagomonas_calceolata.AAC.3